MFDMPLYDNVHAKLLNKNILLLIYTNKRKIANICKLYTILCKITHVENSWIREYYYVQSNFSDIKKNDLFFFLN